MDGSALRQGPSCFIECCACNRSGDSTARIWDLSKLAEGGEATSISLPHSSPDDKEKPKDVTTLDWSGNGQLLATGSYDGLARVWSKEGALVSIPKSFSCMGRLRPALAACSWQCIAEQTPRRQTSQ